MIYKLLADLVLLIHFCIAAFIVLGLVLIIVGGVRHWQWIRNPLFRYTHLAGIGYVVIQSWLGQLCPLTGLENYLREQAGEASYPGSFIAHWVGQLLYYDLPLWVFALSYTLFAVLVLICWFKYKPVK